MSKRLKQTSKRIKKIFNEKILPFCQTCKRRLGIWFGEIKRYSKRAILYIKNKKKANEKKKSIHSRKEKETLTKLADDKKDKKYSDKDFVKNIDTFKKKFSLTLSKGVILKNMVDDYKNKKYSITGAIDESKYDKSKFDINDFEKKDLDKIISHYKAQKKSKVNFLDKKFSIRELEIMNKIDDEGLKKKFSLTNSKKILLKNMFDDLKDKKFDLSAVPEKLKVDIKKIDKEKLNKILDYYKLSKEKKPISFIRQSRIKQMKSDLKAKLNSL